MAKIIPFQSAGVRERLIDTHRSLVRPIAEQVKRKLPPSFEVDDLIGTGNLALVRAASSYAPDTHNGTPFEVYARIVVRGAIIESVRRRRYDENTAPPLEFAEEPQAESAVEAAIDLGRKLARVEAAVNELPPVLRKVIELHYTHDVKLHAIGKRLRKGKSRASQLHMEAIRELRRTLRAA